MMKDKVLIYRGGGTGGVGPPLELEIYLVKFLKIRKKKFFLVSDPPGKNRSPAHGYDHKC